MRPGAVVAGGILLLLGVAMLVDNTGMLQVQAGRLVAPLFLIAMGSAIVLDRGRCSGDAAPAEEEPGRRMRRRRRGGPFAGIWLIGVGIWLLVSQTHLFGLDFDSSWPLLIIFAGVIIVMRGIR